MLTVLLEYIDRMKQTFGRGYLPIILIIITVEPRLSDSRLSAPSIIRNDVQKFLKQAK